jgi:hypothetical protein
MGIVGEQVRRGKIIGLSNGCCFAVERSKQLIASPAAIGDVLFSVERNFAVDPRRLSRFSPELARRGPVTLTGDPLSFLAVPYRVLSPLGSTSPAVCG